MFRSTSNWPYYGVGCSPSGVLGVRGFYGIHIGDGGNINTLVVKNNRVGMNTANPNTTLDVSGTVNATTYTGTTITNLSNLGLYGSNTANTATTTATWGSNTAVWSSNNLFPNSGGVISGNLMVQGELWAVQTLKVGNESFLEPGIYTTSRIAFGGTAGDEGFDNCAIANRKYDSANEYSELVLAKFNDTTDRIRLRAGTIVFDTYPSSVNPNGTDGDFTASNIRMMIASGGNVGINTTSPTTTLFVNGTSTTTDLYTTGNTYFKKGSAASTGFSHLPFSDGNNYLRGSTIIADNGGYLIVGDTSTDTSKLYVNGVGSFTSGLKVGGTIGNTIKYMKYLAVGCGTSTGSAQKVITGVSTGVTLPSANYLAWFTFDNGNVNDSFVGKIHTRTTTSFTLVITRVDGANWTNNLTAYITLYEF
jgi:hypothetical protein